MVSYFQLVQKVLIAYVLNNKLAYCIVSILFRKKSKICKISYQLSKYKKKTRIIDKHGLQII